LLRPDGDGSWSCRQHLDHERSFAANVAGLNGESKQLRAPLEPIVDMTGQ
jgi:hypothetical protein